MGGVSLPPVPFFLPSSPFGVGRSKSPICLHTNLRNRAGKRKRIFRPENPRLHYRLGSLAVGSLSRSEASNWFWNCTGRGRNCTGTGTELYRDGEGFGQRRGRIWTETGRDLYRDGEGFRQRRGGIWTETGKDLDRDGEGFGQRRGRIWTETGKDLDRDGEGFGQRRERIWTETGKDLHRDGLFK